MPAGAEDRRQGEGREEPQKDERGFLREQVQPHQHHRAEGDQHEAGGQQQIVALAPELLRVLLERTTFVASRTV